MAGATRQKILDAAEKLLLLKGKVLPILRGAF